MSQPDVELLKRILDTLQNSSEDSSTTNEMLLMPKYASQEYWENRYKIQQTQHFEWYGSWSHIQTALHQMPHNIHINHTHTIAVIGCGDSKLSHDVQKEIHPQRIVNVDYSPAVIQRMEYIHQHCCPHMEWITADVTNLKEFESSSFDFVIDKGLFDAIASDDDCANAQKCLELMLKESRRLLQKHSGRFILVSHTGDNSRTDLIRTVFPSAEITKTSETGLDYGFFLYTIDFGRYSEI